MLVDRKIGMKTNRPEACVLTVRYSHFTHRLQVCECACSPNLHQMLMCSIRAQHAAGLQESVIKEFTPDGVI